METGPGKKPLKRKPPRLLEMLAGWIVPPGAGEELLARQFETYTSASRCILHILRYLPDIFKIQLGRTFDPVLFAGQAVLLYILFISFEQTPASVQLAAALLATLHLIDVYRFPATGSTRELLVDAAVIGGAIVSLAALFPVSTDVVIRGAVFSLVLLPVMRQQIRRARLEQWAQATGAAIEDELRRLARTTFQSAWTLNVLWMLVCVAVSLRIKWIADMGDFDPWGQLMIFIFAGRALYDAQRNRGEFALFFESGNPWSSNLLVRQRNSVPIAQPRADRQYLMFCEILFFAGAAVPFIRLFRRWRAGSLAPDLGALDFAAMVAGFVAVILVWPLIQAFNRKSAALLQQSIDTSSQNAAV